MEEEIKNLKQEIEAIKVRNQRVETDKAWETSWCRRIMICLLTYAVVLMYSYLIAQTSSIFFEFVSASDWLYAVNFIIKIHS